MYIFLTLVGGYFQKHEYVRLPGRRNMTFLPGPPLPQRVTNLPLMPGEQGHIPRAGTRGWAFGGKMFEHEEC